MPLTLSLTPSSSGSGCGSLISPLSECLTWYYSRIKFLVASAPLLFFFSLLCSALFDSYQLLDCSRPLAMAPGRCSCGGWYYGNGCCSNGRDGVDGVHKGPGWMQHRGRQAQRNPKREREPDPDPSSCAVVAGPPPVRPCFVGPCAQGATWEVTGVRGRARSTVLACHRHMLELLTSSDVQVEVVRATSG